MSKRNLQELFDQQTNVGSKDHYIVSKETRAKMRESHVGREGKPNSPETRAKMSNSLKGREVWNKGVPATDSRKDNISKAKKGKPNPKKSKPIITPYGEFPSAKLAAAYEGISYIALWYKMKARPDQYYYSGASND